jgi:hypothetical protein
MRLEEADPKGLVRESYRIEGISPGECRTVFMDWALSLPASAAVPAALQAVIAHYAALHPDHPMTVVLHEGLGASDPPRRRGGRAARVAGEADLSAAPPPLPPAR